MHKYVFFCTRVSVFIFLFIIYRRYVRCFLWNPLLEKCNMFKTVFSFISSIICTCMYEGMYLLCMCHMYVQYVVCMYAWFAFASSLCFFFPFCLKNVVCLDFFSLHHFQSLKNNVQEKSVCTLNFLGVSD